MLNSGISPARPFSAASRTKLPDELVPVRDQLREHFGLAGGVDLRIAEKGAQLGHVVDRCRERGEVGGDRVDAVRLLRRLEERAGVHALRDCHA